MDDRIERVVGLTDGPTVLDLGAVQHDAANASSDEWLHAHLVDRFETVIGVDVLADDVARLNREGYDIRHADATDMSLDIAADTVVMGELIEHVANPGDLLATARDHLKPGGAVVCSTPNPWGLPVLKRLLLGRQGVNDEHVAWYGPTVLRQLFERYGFAVETLETTRRDHGGLTRLAQWADADVFGGTTWICKARQQ